MKQLIGNSRVFVSVISHNSELVIKQLNCLNELAGELFVIVKSNTPNEDLSFIDSINFHWVDRDYWRGFGENNNIVFDYCVSHLGMQNNDFFIVLNPDVLVSPEQIFELIDNMLSEKASIAAINLYHDINFSNEDQSIRKFPNFLTFVKSFFGFTGSYVLNKHGISQPTSVDWAAGSFLAFNVSHYKKLAGFDVGYFMYCEDIDICYRSRLLGESVRYFPHIKGVHLAAHNNRKLLSKHFYWHIRSSLRFLFKKNFR